ncbi:MAG: radical SAM protein, partial [Acidobacteriota bacterium]
ARGGEELAPMTLLAAREGWRTAMKEYAAQAANVLDREHGQDEAFPWECVDIGVSREALWDEWQRYKEGRRSPKCPDEPCGRCDACSWA